MTSLSSSGVELLRDHLRSLYDNVPFDASVYDSKQLGRVRQCAGLLELRRQRSNESLLPSFAVQIREVQLGVMLVAPLPYERQGLR